MKTLLLSILPFVAIMVTVTNVNAQNYGSNQLTTQAGVAVNIQPFKLVLPASCEAQVKLMRLESNPEKFSVGYACNNAQNGSYYMDFRLNNTDIEADFAKNDNKVKISKTHFNGYTLYDIEDSSMGDKPFYFSSFCTKNICLDLVGDYEPYVKASITAQLRGEQ